MKRLIPFILVLFLAFYAHAATEKPSPPGKGTYIELGEDAEFGQCLCDDGLSVGGDSSRITGDPTAEYISFEDEGIIILQGVGGAQNSDLTIKLDKASPNIYSENSSNVNFLDAFSVVPGTDTGDTDFSSLTITGKVNKAAASTNTNFIALINQYVGGSNYSAGSQVVGLDISNGSAIAGFGEGDGGSANLESVGLDISGGFGLAATFTTGDINVAKFRIAEAGTVVSGDATGISLFESDVSVAGSQTMIKVEASTQGATNYQVVLEGDGAGGGIWLGGITDGCRLYVDATADDCAGGAVLLEGTINDLCADCN
jgi:hypothetical protein